MNRATRWRLLGAFALLCAASAPALHAQSAFGDGTYVLSGGSYSIQARLQGDRLIVVEPNRTSEYTRQADGTYHFTNPNNGVTYGIRVIDNQTIEAFRPFESGNVPTRLVRRGGSPSIQSVQVPAAAMAAGGDAAVAERYRQRAVTDPNDAQAWTACAAAAFKRSVATSAEADAYAVQMAQVLRLIVVDPSRSPCEDAIPQSAWQAAAAAGSDAVPSGPSVAIRAADLEEQRRVEALNGSILDRHRQVEAQNAQAQEQFARERAAHQREVQAAEAARQQYERNLAEHRRQAEAHQRALERHRACVAGDRASCEGSR